MSVLKQRLHRKNESGTYDVVYLETTSESVLHENTSLEAKLISLPKTSNSSPTSLVLGEFVIDATAKLHVGLGGKIAQFENRPVYIWKKYSIGYSTTYRWNRYNIATISTTIYTWNKYGTSEQNTINQSSPTNWLTIASDYRPLIDFNNTTAYSSNITKGSNGDCVLSNPSMSSHINMISGRSDFYVIYAGSISYYHKPPVSGAITKSPIYVFSGTGASTSGSTGVYFYYTWNSSYGTYSYYYANVTITTTITGDGKLIGSVSSTSSTTYPKSGAQGGYWYSSTGSRVETTQSKGSPSGQVTSSSSGSYPNDGISGGYWYTYSGSSSNPYRGSYIGDVESSNINTYPSNGISGNYWYVRQ